MPIQANTLYRDSFNFLRNQLFIILLLTLLSALTNMMINHFFLPPPEQLNMLESTIERVTSENVGIKQIIDQMNPEQKMALLKVSASETFSMLLGHALFIGGVLSLTIQISKDHSVNLLSTLSAFLPRLPKLFLLIFICTLLIQVGLTAFIIPGIIIGLSVSLSPIILINEKTGVFSAIKCSARISFAHARLIIPALLLWASAKFILLFLANRLDIFSHNIMLLIFNIFNYFLLAFLMIYLFRLYMLLRS